MEMTLNQASLPFVVYGLGQAGQALVDAMLDSGMAVACILDRQKGGTHYRNVRVLTLDTFLAQENSGEYRCVVGLHNHYVDLQALFKELVSKGFHEVLSLVQFVRRFPIVQFTSYWLDTAFDYSALTEKAAQFSKMLADGKSRALLATIMDYRLHGEIAACPHPSLYDEYTPEDLPRFADKLRLIDCGAHIGTSIEKFQAAGYEIEALAAFEPDPGNFGLLSQKSFGQAPTSFFPLGVWSSNVQLRFTAAGTMGSAIQSDGDTLIQCASIDQTLRHFAPNLIKMDVEGAEMEALKGAERTLRQYQPNLCISLYHRPEQLLDIPLYLHSLAPAYTYQLRVHEFNTFGVVLYCHRQT